MVFKKIVEEELAPEGLEQLIGQLEKNISDVNTQISQNPVLSATLGKQAAASNTTLQSLKSYLASSKKNQKEQEEQKKLEQATAAKQQAQQTAINNASPGIKKALPTTQTPQQAPQQNTVKTT